MLLLRRLVIVFGAALAASCDSGTGIEDRVPPPSVTTAELPPGVVGGTYAATLQAEGGDGVFSWQVGAGELPGGIALAADGTLSGTPTAAGAFAFTVRVESAAKSDSADLTIEVVEPLSITTDELPSATAGSAYEASLHASGGTGTYTWSVSSGALPPGMALAAEGTLSGTPTTTGTSTFTVQVVSSEQTDEAALSLAVSSGETARMVVVEGDAQQGTVGEELLEPLVVRAEDDHGNPVTDQIVNFVVVKGGGSVFAGAAQTNQRGEARERWTLGTVASDSQRVEARAVDSDTGEKLVFATFHAAALPGAPDSLMRVDGDGQQGTVGQPLASPLAVRLADRYGNPVPDQEVGWATADEGGAVTPTSSGSDSAGVARTEWTLGNRAGAQSARASVGGAVVTFGATAAAGPVESFRVLEDTLRFGALESSAQLTAVASDAFGNAIPDADVRWSSSDAATATVTSEGRVQARAEGTALVAGQVGDRADTAVVVVEQVPHAVAVTPSRDTLTVGESLQLQAQVADSNGVALSSPAVEWTASDESVVRVEQDGVAEAAGRGEAWVVARSGSAADSSRITVLREDSIPPVLVITRPVDYDVATPELRIVAECIDDDPEGCVSITVTLDGQTLARGQTALDTVVSLAGRRGLTELRFWVRDPLHAPPAEPRVVWVDDSPTLERVDEVRGVIMDAGPDRILYLDSISDPGVAAVKIRDRSAGTDVTIHDGIRPIDGHLTSRGAFVTDAPLGGRRRLYEWRDGAVNDHGEIVGFSTGGDWAIWSFGSPGAWSLMRYDVAAGTGSVIATDAGNTSNDVAPDGNVAYWSTGYDVFLYSGGSTHRLTTDSGTVRNVEPRTDGTLVVYQKNDLCPPACGRTSWQDRIVLHDGSQEHVLSGPDVHEVGRDEYEVEDGWVSFTRPDAGGVRQVWARSSAGEEQQATDLPQYSLIESMGPGGKVVLKSGGRRYLWTPAGGLRDVSSGIGLSIWIAGEPYIVIGTSLFRIR